MYPLIIILSTIMNSNEFSDTDIIFTISTTCSHAFNFCQVSVLLFLKFPFRKYAICFGILVLHVPKLTHQPVCDLLLNKEQCNFSSTRTKTNSSTAYLRYWFYLLVLFFLCFYCFAYNRKKTRFLRRSLLVEFLP